MGPGSSGQYYLTLPTPYLTGIKWPKVKARSFDRPRSAPIRSDRPDPFTASHHACFNGMVPDGDGKVSKYEFLGAATAHHHAADTDGKVSPWEHRRQNWN